MFKLVSAKKCSIRLIHASSYKKRTHTQFTQFKLHFQQFGILFYFILILFADATKLSSSVFLVFVFIVWRHLSFPCWFFLCFFHFLHSAILFQVSLQLAFLFVWWFPILVWFAAFCDCVCRTLKFFYIYSKRKKKWNNNGSHDIVSRLSKSCLGSKGHDGKIEVDCKWNKTTSIVGKGKKKSKIRQKQVFILFLTKSTNTYIVVHKKQIQLNARLFEQTNDTRIVSAQI